MFNFVCRISAQSGGPHAAAWGPSLIGGSLCVVAALFVNLFVNPLVVLVGAHLRRIVLKIGLEIDFNYFRAADL